MIKKKLAKAAMLLSMVLAVTACGGMDPNAGVSNSSAEKTENEEVREADDITKQYPAFVDNGGEVVEDAILKVAYASDSGFKGIFNPFFYSNNDDNQFMQYTMCGAFPVDGNFRLILDSDKTPIKMSVDEDAKTVSYEINPKFKWNDGTNVTTADIVKTYEICANQEFIQAAKSPRFGSDMHIIEGIEAYNRGEADHISGLEVIDDSHMIIHLTEMNPGVLYGGPFCGEFVKASDLEGIPMDQILECDSFRKNPPSYGPYVMKSILPGQRVVYEANPYYYKGEAKVKKLEMEVLPTSQEVAAIKSGKYDIVLSASSDIFPQLAELDNISLLTRPELYLSFMGFKLGKWDAETNTCITIPDMKMSDVNLRKAMGYAIDNDEIGKQFYHGLRFTAKSPIAPVFKNIHDYSMTGYHMDLDKANALLDEAGFKDVDGDGIREDKEGKPLHINLAMMSGGEIAEPLSQYYLQQWAEIGLDVSLVNDRLIDFHDFYERVENDDPEIDVFMAAFGLASDPNPSGLYGKHESFNLSRYTSENMDKALANIASNEALNIDKSIEFYRNFENVFFEEAPVIPMQNKVDFIPVNKRVKYYDWRYDDSESNFDWSKIELTAEDPIVASK